MDSLTLSGWCNAVTSAPEKDSLAGPTHEDIERFTNGGYAVSNGGVRNG